MTKVDFLECGICKEQVWDRFRLLYCSHVFCKPCLKNCMAEKTNCKDLLCPAPTCSNPIALYDILCMFTQVELEDLFAQLKVEFLANNSRRFKYCPTPNCENILEKTGENLMMFCTVCGYDSCFDCSKSHYNSSCLIKPTNSRVRVR